MLRARFLVACLVLLASACRAGARSGRAPAEVAPVPAERSAPAPTARLRAEYYQISDG